MKYLPNRPGISRAFATTKDDYKESCGQPCNVTLVRIAHVVVSAAGAQTPDGSTSTKVTHGIAGREVVLAILYEMHLRPEKGTRNSKILSDYTGPER